MSWSKGEGGFGVFRGLMPLAEKVSAETLNPKPLNPVTLAKFNLKARHGSGLVWL